MSRGNGAAAPEAATTIGTGIVDAHHHIWRRTDLPWLEGPMQPRIFGPYESIRRDYPIAEYIGDLEGTGVTKSVYVQANWSPDRFEDEVAWVQSVADEIGWPHAIVGYADFLVDDVRPQLDRLARYPLMRGLRMQTHWHANPEYRFATRPDLVVDRTFMRNVRHLADYGWTFDLQVFESQMADAAALAAACPKVTFVLQHAGMLEDTSSEGRFAWRGGMDALAARQNVVAKLSGLGTFRRRNDPEHIRWITLETIARFGPRRCLFGSNFPIEKIWTDYTALIQAHLDATTAFADVQRHEIFTGTATRIYRLEP